jgi:catechol 2,3-dioxygenase
MRETTVPLPTGVSHVHLWVANLERSLGFYRDLLGLHITHDMRQEPPGREVVFLSASDYHHHVALARRPGATPAPPTAVGLFHFALLYPTRRDLALTLRRMREADYPIDGIRDYGPSEVVNVRDPDGIGVELAWDRPRDAWFDAAGKYRVFNQRLGTDLLDELAGPARSEADGARATDLTPA